MKRILLTALIAGGLACDAVPLYRPCRRVPQKVGQMYKVSWKQIAAGGGAASAVIAAYKVSDGRSAGAETCRRKETGTRHRSVKRSDSAVPVCALVHQPCRTHMDCAQNL